MSVLIPFTAPAPAPAPFRESQPSSEGDAPVVALRSGGSASHGGRSARASSRARRWDPAFHVDLLRF